VCARRAAPLSRSRSREGRVVVVETEGRAAGGGLHQRAPALPFFFWLLSQDASRGGPSGRPVRGPRPPTPRPGGRPGPRPAQWGASEGVAGGQGARARGGRARPKRARGRCSRSPPLTRARHARPPRPGGCAVKPHPTRPRGVAGWVTKTVRGAAGGARGGGPCRAPRFGGRGPRAKFFVRRRAASHPPPRRRPPRAPPAGRLSSPSLPPVAFSAWSTHRQKALAGRGDLLGLWGEGGSVHKKLGGRGVRVFFSFLRSRPGGRSPPWAKAPSSRLPARRPRTPPPHLCPP
jgi:hypothetical protein